MSVIRVNFDTEWEVPVFVNREGFHDLAIDGPKEALRYMRNDFPRRGSELYWNAIDACYAALRFRTDPERARAYFIAAWGEQQSRLHS
jgi:hypothetical protein